jgi:1,4-dihydroxy-6-naphthoate synthase
MKLTIGISPCPNDTFIFDALINQKIETAGFEFEPILEDVETLNEWALQGKLDITKLSFPAFFQSQSTYQLLNAGSALGKGVGPLLIAKKPITKLSEVNQMSVLLPGVNTTAHLLFSIAFPQATQKSFQHFSVIEDAVINGEVDLGVIIHENRFTYQHRGLQLVMDLGSNWESQMKVPIPLGGIAMKRTLKEQSGKINTLIQESLAFAWKNKPTVSNFVIEHAQAMSTDVMNSHINLYVNDFTMDLKEEGKAAIKKLHEVYQQINPSVQQHTHPDIFF